MSCFFGGLAILDLGTCSRLDLYRFLDYQYFWHTYFHRQVWDDRLLGIYFKQSDRTSCQHSCNFCATLSYTSSLPSKSDCHSEFFLNRKAYTI